MPGTTPVYGFRYQLLSDAPHGPNLGLQGFTDVENKIVTMDTASTMQFFTVSGTWNKPANLKAVRVRVVGGGGAGGASGTTGAAQGSAGGGGGGGEYAEAVIPAATLGATVAVTVGAAGAVSGGAGGTSSFGAHEIGRAHV